MTRKSTNHLHLPSLANMASVLFVVFGIVMLFLPTDISAGKRATAPDSIDGAITVSAEEVIKLLISNPDLVLIDARKQSEYIKGHIEGAINLLNTDMNRHTLRTLCPDSDDAIVFYCNGPTCLRSSDSVKKALSWGYSNIFWFRGGWKEWQDKWLPVVTGE